MIIRLIHIVFACLLLSSCTNDKQTQSVVRLVNEWKGKTIILPQNMSDIITNEPIIIDGDFTILHYVDSEGCTGCKMKLAFWGDFLDSINSQSNYDIRMLTVVDSKNIDEIKSDLLRFHYDYPIFADTAGIFNQSNNFPEYAMFQTFLLDKTGKVIILGDPILNEAVGKLYKSVFDGTLIFSQSTNSSVSVIPNKKLWLDTLKLGIPQRGFLSLVNHGNDSLHIQSLKPSCECITVNALSNTINPNDSLTLSLSVKEDFHLGPFDSYVLVNIYKFDNPIILHVSGIVVK